MDLRDEIAASFPPPRADEPAGLRQEIIDELADHLACAHRRELLRGLDPVAARRSVLERFGDPAVLAIQLWLDAMKGKIMTQRLLIAACLLVAVAGLSLSGVVWLQARRATAEAVEARISLSAALAEAQATNKDMMAKLAEMSDAVRNPRSPGWNPVILKLVREKADGPPVKGQAVTLHRQGVQASTVIERKSDDNGVVDFGLVEPDRYDVDIRSSFKGGYQNGYGQIDVQPGSDVRKSIICPPVTPERSPVRIKWAWPADLEAKGLVLEALFAFTYRSFEPSVTWVVGYDAPPRPKPAAARISLNLDGFTDVPAAHAVLCGPGQSLTQIRQSRGLVLWSEKPRSNTEDEAALAGNWADVVEKDVAELPATGKTVSWESGRYRLMELIVLRAARPNQPGRRKTFEVVAGAWRPGFNRLIRRYPRPVDGHGSTPWPNDEDFERTYPMWLSLALRNRARAALRVCLGAAHDRTLGGRVAERAQRLQCESGRGQ